MNGKVEVPPYPSTSVGKCRQFEESWTSSIRQHHDKLTNFDVILYRLSIYLIASHNEETL